MLLSLIASVLLTGSTYSEGNMPLLPLTTP
jgi:hypothetical protein